MAGDRAYEMLWDCGYCGAQKLLGKSQKFCPQCGAPQDTQARYFPDEPDKVEVLGHRYEGADKICPACQAPNGALAEFCGRCGSPLSEAARAKRLQDQVRADEAKFAASLSLRQQEAERRRWPLRPGQGISGFIFGLRWWCPAITGGKRSRSSVTGRWPNRRGAIPCRSRPMGLPGIRKSARINKSPTARIARCGGWTGAMAPSPSIRNAAPNTAANPSTTSAAITASTAGRGAARPAPKATTLRRAGRQRVWRVPAHAWVASGKAGANRASRSCCAARAGSTAAAWRRKLGAGCGTAVVGPSRSGRWISNRVAIA